MKSRRLTAPKQFFEKFRSLRAAVIGLAILVPPADAAFAGRPSFLGAPQKDETEEMTLPNAEIIPVTPSESTTRQTPPPESPISHETNPSPNFMASDDFSPSDGLPPFAPSTPSAKTASAAQTKTPIIPELSETDSPEKKSENVPGLFFRMIANLLLVLAAVFLLFYFLKRFAPRQNQPGSKGIIDVVGEYPLTMKARLSILRFGSKLILVSIGGDRVETLAVIDDPAEIAEIESRCRTESASPLPSLAEQWIEKFWKRKGPR